MELRAATHPSGESCKNLWCCNERRNGSGIQNEISVYIRMVMALNGEGLLLWFEKPKKYISRNRYNIWKTGSKNTRERRTEFILEQIV